MNGLIQGEQTLSEYEQVLANYGGIATPSGSLSDVSLLLIGAAILGTILILTLK
jgi:hypothetical protein